MLLNHADRTPTKLDHKDHSGASRKETEDIERATAALLEIAKLGKVATIGRPDGVRHRLYKRISSTLRELLIHICELL